MKTKVKILCDLLVVDYCSKELDFLDNYYMFFGMENITALYANDDEENNLIKEKGKYIKTKDHLHKLFNGDDPVGNLPVECHSRMYYEQEIEYVIEHDGEFDIKKLQLVKSDYECPEFPYLIIADYIMYDGKEIQECSDLCDYDVESKCYNEFEITELY